MNAKTVRALLAGGVLAGAVTMVATTPPRLGLDLRGGTQIILETQDTPTRKATSEATDRTLEVLRHRVDALGVSEPTLARSGERRIIVELPDVHDPAAAAEVIGRTAHLTFHGVGDDQTGPPTPVQPDSAGDRAGQVVADESGQALRLGPEALSGEDVAGATAVTEGQIGAWQVSIDFRGGGDRKWEALTGAAACAAPGDPQRRIAILLDGKVISSPNVETTVRCGVGITGGSTIITGQFTQSEAQELALLIRAGALPVPVTTIEQHTIGPTLGEEAIEASVYAAIIGATLTIMFIVLTYRLAGAIAAIALGAYGVIAFALLLAIGATLTLPGVAGFVLAIGMAVDANVLVFERAREEFGGAAQGRLRRAIVRGFRGAWSAIVDSNVTTLIAAGLLFLFASGPVRGFGVTLGIGVLASMFTTLVLSRVLLDFAADSTSLRRRVTWSGLAGEGRLRRWLTRREPHLLRHPRRWLLGSLAALVVSLGGIASQGLDYGVEFTGGRLLEFSTTSPVSPDVARGIVTEAGLTQAVVQSSGGNRVLIRDTAISDAQKIDLSRALAARGGSVEQTRDDFIGPTIGAELKAKAFTAFGIALAAQMIYLAVRFRWTYAVSAVCAMGHDVALVVGLFAWLGRPIDAVFLAALLTVIGYSVNDSVVVFDRLRELLRGGRREPFAVIANRACLQTVPRTLNTGIGAMFILGALAVLGGGALTDFALALLVGLLIGTYSSMFTATPLAIVLERRWPGQVAALVPAPTTASSRRRSAALRTAQGR